ncbi:MAG TPA: response regulator transcription factor [Nocardioides sp.]|uniref:response regulator transcription factor n=1 Tax=Nocardioides sp. TaxID=35761 RepID=UPI002BE73D52|nr:response regulator transcription factor [Nocardioides sp.]HTW13886.1 response regulator transcription factor [Nocardioides sp.]
MAEQVVPRDEAIEVFILDDHEVVRLGLRELLEAEDDIVVVAEAATAQEAVNEIPRLSPDVAIIDNRLTDGSGIDVCREVRSQDPGVAVLILTSFDDDEAIFAAILAGASGYLLKQVKGSDLVAAVRRIAAGQSLLDPAVTTRVLDRLRKGPEELGPIGTLTAQELRILELIGDGLTNRQIASQMYLAEKTVKNYVSAMLAKLGVQTRTQAAVYATKHPYSGDPKNRY